MAFFPLLQRASENLGAACMEGRTAFHNIGDKVKESHKSTDFFLAASKFRIRSDAPHRKLPEYFFDIFR